VFGNSVKRTNGHRVVLPGGWRGQSAANANDRGLGIAGGMTETQVRLH
jgi:hypothetical protein